MSTLLARVGIGALTIDTVLEDLRVTPGGTLRGTVVLEGGDIRQTVERITLSLTTNFRRGGQLEPVLLGRTRLGEGTTVRSSETRALGFAMPVPPTTPVTMGEQRVTLRTRASVARSVNQMEIDPKRPLPHSYTKRDALIGPIAVLVTIFTCFLLSLLLQALR